MTDQSVPGTVGNPNEIPAPRAHKMALQGLMNTMMRGMLRTPLLSQVIGRQLVTLYVMGRKSGQRYVIPVAYTAQDGDLLIGTPFKWGRNLQTGEPLEIRLKGRLRQADVVAYKDEAGVVGLYRTMCRDNHRFAGFNKIGFDASGNPDPEDMHLAWMAGARAFRLTPR